MHTQCAMKLKIENERRRKWSQRIAMAKLQNHRRSDRNQKKLNQFNNTSKNLFLPFINAQQSKLTCMVLSYFVHSFWHTKPKETISFWYQIIVWNSFRIFIVILLAVACCCCCCRCRWCCCSLFSFPSFFFCLAHVFPCLHSTHSIFFQWYFLCLSLTHSFFWLSKSIQITL